MSDCDNMLMLLGVSQKFSMKQREVVTPLLIQGFTGERGKVVVVVMSWLMCVVSFLDDLFSLKISAKRLEAAAMVVRL